LSIEQRIAELKSTQYFGSLCRKLEKAEEALGPDHILTLEAVNTLGIIYSDQGKLQDADEMFHLAFKGCEKALGPDHTSTLRMFHNLGNHYVDQGKLEEADKMYQHAINGYEKTLGLDHTSALNTVNNLGVLYSDQGKLKEAEEMYHLALKGYEKYYKRYVSLTSHKISPISTLPFQMLFDPATDLAGLLASLPSEDQQLAERCKARLQISRYHDELPKYTSLIIVTILSSRILRRT
jgi:tetratricopeptide (TPR) repeat protein